MVQMTQNLDQICISMVSNKFQKIFENFQKWPIFGRKTPFFAFFALRFSMPQLLRKVTTGRPRWSNWPDFWYICSLGYLQQIYKSDLANFDFWPRFRVICRPRGSILTYFRQFLTKIFWNLLETIGIHIWSKFWVIWTIFMDFTDF